MNGSNVVSRRTLLLRGFLAFSAAFLLAPIATLAQGTLPIPTFGDDLMLASAVVGFFVPLAIAAINRRRWSSEAKGASAFLICLIASGLLVYVMGLVSTESWLRSALIVVFMAINTHNFFWKPSGIAGDVEAATG